MAWGGVWWTTHLILTMSCLRARALTVRGPHPPIPHSAPSAGAPSLSGENTELVTEVRTECTHVMGSRLHAGKAKAVPRAKAVRSSTSRGCWGSGGGQLYRLGGPYRAMEHGQKAGGKAYRSLLVIRKVTCEGACSPSCPPIVSPACGPGPTPQPIVAAYELSLCCQPASSLQLLPLLQLLHLVQAD